MDPTNSAIAAAANWRKKSRCRTPPRIIPMVFWNGTPCMPWCGTICPDKGYGRFCIDGKSRGAHVAVYENIRGPVPDGMVLDHLCRNRACVNPDHLEPVTNKENVLRGVGRTAINAAKTECCKGHPLSGENLYVTPNGRRVCRTCSDANDERQKQRAWLRRHLPPMRHSDWTAHLAPKETT